MFDADWQQHGYIDRVVRDAAAWVERKNVAGLKLEVVRLEGRTPVIFFDVPATRPGGNDAGADTICLYGHLDKQPEFNGWRNDLGPWTPQYENGLLYGRGGADDGYAIYAVDHRDHGARPAGHPAAALRRPDRELRGERLARPAGLRRRAARRGSATSASSSASTAAPATTTSSGSPPACAASVSGTLKVEILTEGVHSGDASGLVPSSFRILRQVLDRLEDSKTGRLLPESFHCAIPGRPHRAGAGDRADPRRRGLEALPVGLRRRRRRRRCRPPPTRSRRCSTAPGGRRCRSPAPTASRR